MAITKVTALDLAPYRIHCNAICPGCKQFKSSKGLFLLTDKQDVMTAMTEPILGNKEAEKWITARHPFRGLGEPQDIANAALFLASKDSSWISGACMPVDGGYTVT